MRCRAGVEVGRVAVDEHHTAPRGTPHGRIEETGGLDAVGGREPEELGRQRAGLRARGGCEQGGRGEGDGKRPAKLNHGPSQAQACTQDSQWPARAGARAPRRTRLAPGAWTARARETQRTKLSYWTSADLSAGPVFRESGRRSGGLVAGRDGRSACRC